MGRRFLCKIDWWYISGFIKKLRQSNMSRKFKIPAVLLPLLFVYGCGNYYSVRVPYDLPENNNIIETEKALASLYIAVKAPPQPEESAPGGLADGMMDGRRVEPDTYEFARKAALVFSRPGQKVLAYRVFRTQDESDPYIRYFHPSGVLELKISAPAVSVRRENRSSAYYDKDKRKQTVKSVVWVYSASIRVDTKLLSGAGGKVLDKMSDTFACSGERFDNSRSAADWYAENEEKLFGAVTARISARYVGRPVLRERPLFREKNDPGSAKAADLARNGRWLEAENIWAGRLRARKNWRDMMDLAVAAEARKNYRAARDYYLGARESSAGDPEAKPANWGEIMGDLDIMLSTGSAAMPAGDDWFAGAAAILPFTDETTSIDGPPMLRVLMRESLSDAGYRIQPLEDTDKLLLAHGMTQGGQLGAADQAEICKWLGVERLFYGDINEFEEVAAGRYSRRMIKGRLILWDLGAGNFIWGLDTAVVKGNAPKIFPGGMFPQLEQGLIERFRNEPLAYEASVFSAKMTEALPNKIR